MFSVGDIVVTRHVEKWTKSSHQYTWVVAQVFMDPSGTQLVDLHRFGLGYSHGRPRRALSEKYRKLTQMEMVAAVMVRLQGQS